MIKLKRIFRHLLHSPLAARRTFSKNILEAITNVIHKSEAQHTAEIQFIIEDNLDLISLFQNQTARDRAIEVFSHCRLWDTENNNGILIYLLLAERDVEIIVDRGVKSKINTSDLEKICHFMEEEFKQGRFKQGVITGIEELTHHLIKHFRVVGNNNDELSNMPIIL